MDLRAHDAARPLVPASTMKLVTGAAALSRWGPTHRFETPVLATGDLDDAGVLDGDLWIVGAGDPSLVSEQLWKLAEELRLLGLREVRGSIGVDASYFDGVRWHPDWERGSRRAYQAPVAAFAANYSSFRIEVAPGPEAGRGLRVALAPRIPYLHVDASGRTLARGRGIRLKFETREDGESETVRVEGSMTAGDEARTYWRSVASPTAYAASLLREQLRAQGIRVQGGFRYGTPPAGARELLRFRGESLGRIVWLLNKFSSNFVAEQLVKGLGAERSGPPGTWSKGRDAIEAFLTDLGGLAPGETVADGSGLSARNRISARTLVRVLSWAAARFEFGAEYVASLPLGGLDGTLEDRLDGEPVPVRAKTGHLSGVSALCGILDEGAASGHLRFAVIVNGARASAEDVDLALDRFVRSLAAGGDQGAVGEGSAARTRVAY